MKEEKTSTDRKSPRAYLDNVTNEISLATQHLNEANISARALKIRLSREAKPDTPVTRNWLLDKGFIESYAERFMSSDGVLDVEFFDEKPAGVAIHCYPTKCDPTCGAIEQLCRLLKINIGD